MYKFVQHSEQRVVKKPTVVTKKLLKFSKNSNLSAEPHKASRVTDIGSFPHTLLQQKRGSTGGLLGEALNEREEHM